MESVPSVDKEAVEEGVCEFEAVEDALAVVVVEGVAADEVEAYMRVEVEEAEAAATDAVGSKRVGETLAVEVGLAPNVAVAGGEEEGSGLGVGTTRACIVCAPVSTTYSTFAMLSHTAPPGSTSDMPGPRPSKAPRGCETSQQLPATVKAESTTLSTTRTVPKVEPVT